LNKFLIDQMENGFMNSFIETVFFWKTQIGFDSAFWEGTIGNWNNAVKIKRWEIRFKGDVQNTQIL